MAMIRLCGLESMEQCHLLRIQLEQEGLFVHITGEFQEYRPYRARISSTDKGPSVWVLEEDAQSSSKIWIDFSKRAKGIDSEGALRCEYCNSNNVFQKKEEGWKAKFVEAFRRSFMPWKPIQEKLICLDCNRDFSNFQSN